MDYNASATMLQSSEIDTIMQDTDAVLPASKTLSNGFVPSDPSQRTSNDPDFLDSTPEEPSREESQMSSDVTSLPLQRLSWKPTGLCYDERMKLHASADFTDSPHHPEDPRRIEAIFNKFKRAGLVYEGPETDIAKVLAETPTKYMYRIAARHARMDEICLVHTASHFEWVNSLSEKSSAELRAISSELDNGRRSLYVGSLTHEASLISAGGAIETCKNIVEGRCKNGIAVIRPPGHHAEHNLSMGFCIFNNVPIAARVCMTDYPEICRKVLILDWDVHHGNGIQNMFFEDPNVLYISLHVYQNGNFYPGRPDEEGAPDGGLDQIGVGLGVGRNVNIGWHDQGMGDGEYMAAFQGIIMPIAREFDPDLVIISAGFDAAAGDELGGCFVTPACYSHMTHMLMSLAEGKVAVCLEGGYDLTAISNSALAVAKTLMGEPPERIKIPPLNKAAAYVLHQVKMYQALYWECMRAGLPRVQGIEARGGMRLGEVLRGYQYRELNTKYKMLPLYVQREKLARSYKEQVLVTPRLYAKKTVLLIIHDPPEVLASPDPIDGTIYSQNGYVVDGIIPYIDWAVKKGYGVVDVNVPQHDADSIDATLPYSQPYNEKLLSEQTKELLCYLWDNYLETYDVEQIILMGVGDSYCGIKGLLTGRDCRSKIACVLSFVQGALRPIKSETDPHLSAWYKSFSRIYVSPEHSCWNDEDMARKVRKNRFGTVVRSEVEGLREMLTLYWMEATAWVGEVVGEGEREEADTEDGSGGGDGEGESGRKGGRDGRDGRDPDETEEEDDNSGSAGGRNGNGNGNGMQLLLH